MKSSHKRIGSELGRSNERLEIYEQSIKALGDEALAEWMLQQRLELLPNSPDPNFIKDIVQTVLNEEVRRAKLNLKAADTDWGTYR